MISLQRQNALICQDHLEASSVNTQPIQTVPAVVIQKTRSPPGTEKKVLGVRRPEIRALVLLLPDFQHILNFSRTEPWFPHL